MLKWYNYPQLRAGEWKGEDKQRWTHGQEGFSQQHGGQGMDGAQLPQALLLYLFLQAARLMRQERISHCALFVKTHAEKQQLVKHHILLISSHSTGIWKGMWCVRLTRPLRRTSLQQWPAAAEAKQGLEGITEIRISWSSLPRIEVFCFFGFFVLFCFVLNKTCELMFL